MKRLLLPFVFFFVASILIAESATDRADELYEKELHREGYEFLMQAVRNTADANERAELYWRLARATLEVGNLEETEGAEVNALLVRFQEGESYADESIALNPHNHEAYYWKSANIGRWGEVKGILNSLFKAKPMRELLHTALTYYPEHPASFYVLGILYERLPGGIVSFGNANYAVSLGRKAIDANRAEVEAGVEDEIKLSYYTELARHLWVRNWSASKRIKEHAGKARKFREKTDVLERNFYYEGVLDIENVSDREEALRIIRRVVDEFESMPSLTKGQQEDLEEAREDLERWTD